MASDPSSRPSFSRGRKFGIGLNVAIATLAVFAVVVMVNYLSSRIFRRAYLSSLSRVELSSRTTSLLRSLTNDIHVTVYCSKDEPYFAEMADLLKEYNSANRKFKVHFIDYDRDPGAAEQFKIKYHLVGSTNRNLIMFEYEGRTRPVPGDAMVYNRLVLEQNKEGKLDPRKKPEAFMGELLFTGALLSISNPKPLTAYFLVGHGEHRPDDADDLKGYTEFAGVLRQNNIEVGALTLAGTNTVPDDCSLLIIAGPKDAIAPAELDRIEKYLNDGGRLFALFNAATTDRMTGLEKLLAQWGVRVTGGIVKDPDLYMTESGNDVYAVNFRVKHPLVNALLGHAVELIYPREISTLDLSSQPDAGLKAEEVVYSGPRATLSNVTTPQTPGAKPLIVAVEKNPAKGVASERGAARIIVAGDSIFLGNEWIKAAANRDFAGYAANWLVDRPILLEGIGPKSIVEYRLEIPTVQFRTLQWILLAAIPGGILLMGSLVWLRRRK